MLAQGYTHLKAHWELWDLLPSGSLVISAGFWEPLVPTGWTFPQAKCPHDKAADFPQSE